MKKLIFIIFVIASCSTMSAGSKPLDILKDFYAKYIEYVTTDNSETSKPYLPFSKQFNALISKNAYVCENYSSNICGWQADGDAYLDAQETDPNLTFANSGITFEETGEDTILVRLNVYPSASDNGGSDSYVREIKYKMIYEDDVWVVDDIVYKTSGSSKKTVEEETAYYLANPDPDSKVMDKKN